MTQYEPILGLDLGTTYCAMAIVDETGRPVLLPNADGQSTTPSVIHFYESDACVVGAEALKMVVLDPTNVARFVKRSMGEPDFELQYQGRRYTPQELSAIIIRKMKEDAEDLLGVPIHNAVITVPAYFNSAQRGATAEAGTIAGLNVLSIINEPTSAAISYGLERVGAHRNLMVFDLGGGTFDVTLMEIRGLAMNTLASDGNAELGGKDWDDRLLNHVAEQFCLRHDLDPRDDSQSFQELYERCLHAKLALSTQPKAVIPVNYKGHRMVVSVTREQFEEITRDLTLQCIETCELVLDKAGLHWEDLDEVLLVGGATRMPMIRQNLRRRAGELETSCLNPEACVAMGAALVGVLRHQPDHPAMIPHRKALARRAFRTSKGQPQASADLLPAANTQADAPLPMAGSSYGFLPPVKITDVTSQSLGIVVLDPSLNERVVTLIPDGTALPCEERGRFAYAYNNMTAVRVEVTEGSGNSRDQVQVIGQVVLSGLPPRPKGTPIEVIYRYGLNQILEIDVIDVQTRRIRRAKVDLKGAMDAHKIEKARRTLATFQVH